MEEEAVEEREEREEGEGEEGEEEGPPPRPGRRVKFQPRDQLVREFCDQTLWKRGERE